jgi:hypothetical protein
MFLFSTTSFLIILIIAENAVGRDSKHGVDEFRGISFDRWLFMIVQVGL